MKKILTSFKLERGENSGRGAGEKGAAGGAEAIYQDDSPEGRTIYATRSFCESGGPQSPNPGEEVLHLPTIVDAAESSPTAAREAANVIRKYLDLKNNSSRPYVQYNAVMLMRILADNPGRTFTRNLAEPKFASAVKELLRHGKDPGVRQILSESLESFETTKGDDEGLKALREVWIKEKMNMAVPRSKHRPTAPLIPAGSSHYPQQGRPHHRHPSEYHQYQNHQRHQRPVPVPGPGPGPVGLPNVEELAARIAEAQTSAKLLEQVLQSTPSADVSSSELLKEFADRCKSAARSIQTYISSNNPAPDEDTLATLIMTNDLLTMALNKHQKTVKEALEEQEVHKTASARIVNVNDPAVPPVPFFPRGVSQSDGDHHSRDEHDQVPPDSPVTPVTPGTVIYRY